MIQKAIVNTVKKNLHILHSCLMQPGRRASNKMYQTSWTVDSVLRLCALAFHLYFLKEVAIFLFAICSNVDLLVSRNHLVLQRPVKLATEL